MESKTVTERTLSRIDRLVGKTVDETSNTPVPRVIAVLCVSQKRAQQAQRELLSLRHFGYDVEIITLNERVADGTSGILPYARAENHPESVFFENVVALVAVLDQGTAAKLALGLQDSFALEVILHCLWRGIRTFVDFTEVRSPHGQTSRNEKLAKIYDRYVADLYDLGAVETEQKHYVSAVLAYEKEEALDEISLQTRNDDIFFGDGKKRVLTESDILSLENKKTELLLPQDAIVTSLAREAAERLHITLRLRKNQE